MKKTMEKPITVEVLGDICLSYCDYSENELIEIGNAINECFDEMDLRIANLEAPFVENDANPIAKSGPNLLMKKSHIPFLKTVSIDAYTLANNHIGDYGDEGVINTIRELEELGIKHFGAGESFDQAFLPLRVTIRNKTIAFFAVCENEFGVASGNRSGTAGYDEKKVEEMLENERRKSDYVIVLYHGGNEFYPFPSPDQIKRFHFMADCGADVVVGSHSHCLKGMEQYGDSWLVYGVGNFYFPIMSETVFDYWSIGLGIQLDINEKIGITRRFYGFDKLGKKVEVIPSELIEDYYSKLSDTIADNMKIQQLFDAWAYMSGLNMTNSLFADSVNNKKRFLLLKNLFNCESHNEIMRRFTEMVVNNEKPVSGYSREIKRNMLISKQTDVSDRNNGKVILWGCGKKAERALDDYAGEVIAIVDKDSIKQGLFFMDIPIVSPDEAVNKYNSSLYVICTRRESLQSIEEYLKKSGIRNIEYYE